jgi:competence protein ComEC
MRAPIIIPAWKRAPFIRLLLPLVAGIILQWYLQLAFMVFLIALASFSIAFLLFLLLPLALRFKARFLQGFLIQLIFIAAGAWLTWQQDIRHHDAWYGNYYREGSYIIVRIDEPLVEKNKSYKATGYVETVVVDGRPFPCKGKLLMYFSKDSVQPVLQYGDRIVIHKPLQPFRNSGNPGAFDYEQYAAFQNIFHNVFLKEKDWVQITLSANKSKFKQFLFDARTRVLETLQKNIRSGKDELGIAQALLIGYTNDLDKDLVQAYSNTGVVHIIAISGMHLALIYLLLNWIFARIPYINRSKLLQLMLVLSCLWLFSLLTGASASVLRAAVMFTCIAIGKSLRKEASIYASLAASAFLLLCYDPYFLWSVGFQLSYLAVLGILIFQKPVYDILFISNRWLDQVWKLTAVSISAQLLTFPVCIYYFHQFPNLFLLTNIVAVPLSSLVLYLAIALTAFAWMPFMGELLGRLTGAVTWVMNKFILLVNQLPCAVWDKIPATVLSTWILYAVVICFSSWLLFHQKNHLKVGMAAMFLMAILMAGYKWETARQQKLIVYNVPGHQAIDLVKGNEFIFIGDSALLEDGLQQNFHLKPARISNQLLHNRDAIPVFKKNWPFFTILHKRILIIDRTWVLKPAYDQIELDLVIVSNNPSLDIEQLTKIFSCKLIVFDASNSKWKIKKWRQDCLLLKQQVYIVEQSGAFVYNIGI